MIIINVITNSIWISVSQLTLSQFCLNSDTNFCVSIDFHLSMEYLWIKCIIK